MTNNNLFNTKEENKFLTVGDLYLTLEAMIEKNKDIIDLPVMLCENTIKKGTLVPTIRHLESDDITIESNLQLCAEFVFSQFNKGLVLGYVIQTEE